jgi:hypothetical protein
MDARQKTRAARFAVEQLGRLRRDPQWLIRQTDLDPGTVADFLKGERWPRTATRSRIEDALGVDRGTLQMIADGWMDEPQEDRVEAAIEASELLTRAQKLRLRAAYVDMLEAAGIDDRTGVRGA